MIETAGVTKLPGAVITLVIEAEKSLDVRRQRGSFNHGQ